MIAGRPAGVAIEAMAALLLATSFARATDPFEIQTYDGNANEQGAFGLELHTNVVARGVTTSDGPELAPNRVTHFTLEPSYGLFDWWELGLYLQAALLPDGSLDWAGAKVRSKFVTPPKWAGSPHVRLGANFELGLLPERFDKGRWAIEMRPIVAWESDRFLFAVNPNVDITLTQPELSLGPTFQPAAMALYQWKDRVSLGFEYYANFGPFTEPLPLAKQEHYLYEVVNLLTVEHMELNVGFGHGFTDASNAFVGKVIVGYTWGEKDADRLATALAPRRLR